MYLVAIGWLYVAVMMAVVEANASNGTLLGAVFTFLLYGLGPVALVTYVLATPMRQRARKAAEAAAAAAQSSSSAQPDQRGHAPAEALAAERKEP
jgi:hypothetical protein